VRFTIFDLNSGEKFLRVPPRAVAGTRWHPANKPHNRFAIFDDPAAPLVLL
jgi:hypothetical protein